MVAAGNICCGLLLAPANDYATGEAEAVLGGGSEAGEGIVRGDAHAEVGAQVVFKGNAGVDGCSTTIGIEAEGLGREGVGVVGEVPVAITAQDTTGDRIFWLEPEAIGGTTHGHVFTDAGLVDSAVAGAVGPDVGTTVKSAAIDGDAEAFVEVACNAYVPLVLIDALQAIAWGKAGVTGTDVRLVEVGVDVMDGGGAALFAAGFEAGLYGEGAVRLGRWGLRSGSGGGWFLSGGWGGRLGAGFRAGYWASFWAGVGAGFWSYIGVCGLRLQE